MQRWSQLRMICKDVYRQHNAGVKNMYFRIKWSRFEFLIHDLLCNLEPAISPLYFNFLFFFFNEIIMAPLKVCGWRWNQNCFQALEKCQTHRLFLVSGNNDGTIKSLVNSIVVSLSFSPKDFHCIAICRRELGWSVGKPEFWSWICH